MLNPTRTPSNHSTQASQIRSLSFRGSLPLAITFHDPQYTAYVQASRITYLPLLVPLIMAQLGLEGIAGEEVWFDFEGRGLCSQWTIGLLFDYFTSSLSSPNSTIDASSTLPTPLPTPSTKMMMMRKKQKLPFRITLHCGRGDLPKEGLLVGCDVESCRASFMNRLKESDFVRWGSVKRMTNLRKEQQDALWDGLVQKDEEKYWAVASKLIPLPSTLYDASTTTTTASTSATMTTKSKSTTRESTVGDRLPEGNNVRSVPLRIYRGEGQPVIQDLIPPLVDGRPLTLGRHLCKILPTLFSDPSSISKSTTTENASIMIHGLIVPLSMELGWMGSCLVGADGWVSAVLVLDS